MNEQPFIAVEGVIGIGKTSLATIISNEFNYSLLKEIVEENPFLGKFYDDIEEWSFQTEMFFLANRYKQLNDIKHKFLNKNIPVVADYHIFKNTIFSQMTLNQKEYAKYIKIYDILTEDMPKPNLIIYLDANLDTILKRISLRGRDIEKGIDPNYLRLLSEDYHKFMNEFKIQHPEVPVLTFNGDEFDFIKSDYDKNYIISEIRKTLR